MLEQPTLGSESKKLGRNAVVYVSSNLLVTGVSLVLTLLYARTMAPEDLAVVAVANSMIAVLGVILGLALYGCVPRLFFEYDDTQRRVFFGTLLMVSLVFPVAVVAVLYAAGARGYLELFSNVRFDPHIQLVLLTSLAAVYRPLVTTVYMTREQPGKVAGISFASALLQLAFTALFVLQLHEGALGVLRANLASGAATAVVSIALMVRLSTFDLRLPGLVTALAFSVPLVPHLIANWALGISDRLVLDRFVPAADLGRYSLAYVFNLLVGLVAASVVNALSPMANRQLKDGARAENVPPLGTYALFAIVGFALAIALLARELIAAAAPPSYATAFEIVPWVVLGGVFQGMYFIWSIGTWFSMRTRLVPLVTAAGALTNIAINLVFVPRYGVMAAAVSTAIAYAVLAALHGVLAQKLHPIPWEYARWARIIGLGAAWYAAGMVLGSADIVLSVVFKLLVAAVLFPASLVLTGFLSRRERDRLLAAIGRLGRA